MLGRPVRPSVWEITGNVGLRARMRNWGGNWSLKIENCETSSLGKLKISGDLSYHKEKWQMFQKFIINARNRDKMVQSSLFHYKCKVQPLGSKNWSSVEGRGGRGDQLAICKGCKVQKVIYCVCQSLKKRLCTAFSLSWFYVHLLILIFFYENCSSWLSWQASNHFLFFLFFSFLFLPISMSECLWSLECAQNPDWKDSISFL